MVRRIFFLVLLLVASFVALTARAESAAFSGRVLTEQGEPLARATITLTALSELFGFTATTDPGGRLVFRPVAAGEYRFCGRHPEDAECRLNLKVTAGESPQMDIVLPTVVRARE